MSKGELKEKILELLANFQGESIPQSYIHRSISASKSRVSEILYELEREGLIKRKQIGRSKFIYAYTGIKEKAHEKDEMRMTIGIVYSSEYLFLGYFLKKMNEMKRKVNVKVFSDGLEALDALVHGRIDLAISPFIGQLIFSTIYESYKILPRGMGRGYEILYLDGGNKVHSSKLSTMDYIRSLSIKNGIIDAENTVYYSSPDELLYMAKKEKGYVITWHPLYKKVESMGFKVVKDAGIMENELCCSLAISNIVAESVREKITWMYRESLEAYSKDRSRYLELYSIITGIDIDLIKDAMYVYEPFNGDSMKATEEVLDIISPSVPDKSVYLKSIIR
ncbi:MAG: DUF7343 domain-containing protein [Fervidicoccus fontis]